MLFRVTWNKESNTPYLAYAGCQAEKRLDTYNEEPRPNRRGAWKG